MIRMKLSIVDCRLPIRKPASALFLIGQAQSTIRPAFSLVEMMIAIVLLGLGMVMVATMFPVAWTRARQLNEATNLRTVVTAADTVVRSLARVDGRNSNGSAFAGDLVFIRQGDYGLAFPNNLGGVFVYSDTLVHSLSMDNLLVAPRKFLSDLRWDERPWTIDRLDHLWYPGDPPLPELYGRGRHLVEGSLFTSPQVNFAARFHPPMRNRVPGGNFSTPDAAWDEMLDSRRYAWAVLHRLRNPICPDPTPSVAYPAGIPARAEFAYDLIDVRREFDVFYVMLRRPQPTYRYAQQNPDSAPVPGVHDPRVPAALLSNKDVFLPEPWRVQVFFSEPFLSAQCDPRNLPTEVQVNHPGPAKTHSMLVDMFPSGAWFIDEESGLVLQVVKRRIVEGGPNGAYAILTLDREILRVDLGYPPCPPPPEPLPLLPPPHLRTVWVFPPPVQAVRGAGDTPIFDGVQPVVAIERRTLAISPVN